MSAADGGTASTDVGGAGATADGPGGAPAPPQSGSPVVPRIGLIWAQARGGIIGAGGTMPWHLPEDLRHFSRTTKGSPVVMGRRTWQSFPPKYRPLPGRTNIVITRDDAFAAEGAVRARDLPEALELARGMLAEGPGGGAPLDSTSTTLWVIGGGAVYRKVIERADLLVVTEIDLEVDGDTTAPAIPPDFSVATADPETGWHESAGGLRYRILTYTR